MQKKKNPLWTSTPYPPNTLTCKMAANCVFEVIVTGVVLSISERDEDCVNTAWEVYITEAETNCSDTLPLFTGIWQNSLSSGEWRFDSPQSVNKYCAGVSDVTSQALLRRTWLTFQNLHKNSSCEQDWNTYSEEAIILISFKKSGINLHRPVL